ncbi:XPG domain containing-domain-containing protein [Cladochytrium replicatum]|nr:XPG domain containing-domain-containing protein [Cladochytrium replicatum]
MGVRGLTTIVANKCSNAAVTVTWSESQISESARGIRNLVIDGNGYLHHILKLFDCAFGISYPQLHHVLEVRTRALLLAGLNLTFVLDGPLPMWKAAQRVERETDKIANASEVALGIHRAGSVRLPQRNDVIAKWGCDGRPNTTYGIVHGILPVFAVVMFQDILKTLDVPFIISAGEADSAVAQAAKHQNAFIVANDSDFFIYQSLGYIPVDTLRDVGDSKPIIQASVFQHTTVMEILGIPENAASVYASLMLCDYSATEESKIKQWIHDVTPADYTGDRSSLIISILRKLHIQKDWESDIIIQKLLEEFYSESTTAVAKALHFSCKIYEKGSLPLQSGITELATCIPIRTHKLLEISDNCVFWCSTIVESLNSPTVWVMTRRLREALYGIISSGFISNRSDNLLQNHSICTEYIRCGATYQPEPIQPLQVAKVYTLLENQNQNSQDIQVEQFSMNQRYNALYTLLNTDLLQGIDIQYRPVIAGVRYITTQMSVLGNPLTNAEVLGMLCSSINLLHNCQSLNDQHAVQISRSQMQAVAGLEVTYFCAFLLAEVLFPDCEHNFNKVWMSFDGPAIHQAISSAKKGTPPWQILGKFRLEQSFTDLFQAVIHNQEQSIISVMDYTNMNAPIAVSKKKRDIRKQRSRSAKDPTAKKQKKSNNMFDILSNGCMFD